MCIYLLNADGSPICENILLAFLLLINTNLEEDAELVDGTTQDEGRAREEMTEEEIRTALTAGGDEGRRSQVGTQSTIKMKAHGRFDGGRCQGGVSGPTNSLKYSTAVEP